MFKQRVIAAVFINSISEVRSSWIGLKFFNTTKRSSQDNTWLPMKPFLAYYYEIVSLVRRARLKPKWTKYSSALNFSLAVKILYIFRSVASFKEFTPKRTLIECEGAEKAYQMSSYRNKFVWKDVLFFSPTGWESGKIKKEHLWTGKKHWMRGNGN